MVFLGDGEFDGTELQATLSALGWSYVCRTAMSTTATWEGETFRLDVLGTCLQPGRLIELKEVSITRDAYGPVMVLCCWAKGYQEPLYLVSNLATAEEACRVVSEALPYRDIFRRPEKSRLPYSAVAYSRSAAPISVINSGMFSLYLDYLFRLIM